MDKMQTLPVIFKKHYDRDSRTWDVTAFLPTVPENYDGTAMTCYQHVGQHGGASFPFFWSGKKCKPEDYADLLAEMQDIYTNDPDDPIQLVVYQKRTPKMRDEFDAELKRLKRSLESD